MCQCANWLRYNDMPHGTLAYWYIIILAYYYPFVHAVLTRYTDRLNGSMYEMHMSYCMRCTSRTARHAHVVLHDMHISYIVSHRETGPAFRTNKYFLPSLSLLPN